MLSKGHGLICQLSESVQPTQVLITTHLMRILTWTTIKVNQTNYCYALFYIKYNLLMLPQSKTNNLSTNQAYSLGPYERIDM